VPLPNPSPGREGLDKKIIFRGDEAKKREIILVIIL